MGTSGRRRLLIPASETLWLAKEVPQDHLQAALVTPVLSHVNMTDGPSIGDRAKVVHFIAGMLEEARESNRAIKTDESGGGAGGGFYFFPKDESIIPTWSSGPWSY